MSFAIKDAVRRILVKIPLKITQNQWYDHCTLRIMGQILSKDSKCVDVGCHKGEFMDIMLQYAPNGSHIGFEPIPTMYQQLQQKYQKHQNVQIQPYALSDVVGTSTFNYVDTNPAYSGLVKRSYDTTNVIDTTIEVATNRLDACIPDDIKIDLIKIDVEGGELGVLKGGMQTIVRCRPYVIFEHGLGASDHYGTTPEMIFDYFDSLAYDIFLLESFIERRQALAKSDLRKQFYDKLNYYFIAAPKSL